MPLSENEITRAALLLSIQGTRKKAMWALPECMRKIGIDETRASNRTLQAQVRRFEKKFTFAQVLGCVTETYPQTTPETEMMDHSHVAKAAFLQLVLVSGSLSCSECMRHIGIHREFAGYETMQAQVRRYATRLTLVGLLEQVYDIATGSWQPKEAAIDKSLPVVTVVQDDENDSISTMHSPSFSDSSHSVPRTLDSSTTCSSSVTSSPTFSDSSHLTSPTMASSSMDSGVSAPTLKSLKAKAALKPASGGSQRSAVYLTAKQKDAQSKAKNNIAHELITLEKMASLKWANEKCNGVSAQQVSDEIAEEHGVVIPERRIRHLVTTLNCVGKTPPKRGRPSRIPTEAYEALVGAVITYIEIQQENGMKEPDKRTLSKLVNLCVNDHPDEGKRSGSDLFDRIRTHPLFTESMKSGKEKKQEARRNIFCSYYQLKDWFTNFEDFLVKHGFGEKTDNIDYDEYLLNHQKYDLTTGLLSEEEYDEVFFIFFEGMLARLGNLDESGISCDGAGGAQGGRPSLTFSSTKRSRPGTSTQKSSVTGTLVGGCNGHGELYPLHLQYTTAAKEGNVQLEIDAITHENAFVIGKFGLKEETAVPCTFHANTKGGMDGVEFEKMVKDMVQRVYPDARPENGKWVIILTDYGPGRNNLDLMASLRNSGILLYPGLPNSTHLTQIMDQLFGYFKTIVRGNLIILSERRIKKNNGRDCTFTRPDIASIVYGDHDCSDSEDDSEGDNEGEKKMVDSATECFSRKRNLAAYAKCGISPCTRKSLNHRDVRHEIVTSDDGVDNSLDPKAVELEELDQQNHTLCGILTAFQYNGSVFKCAVKRRSSEAMLKQRHAEGSKERQEALAATSYAGKKFMATGGNFLTADDAFKAGEINIRKGRIKELVELRKKATEGNTFAADLADAKQKLAAGKMTIAVLKPLIKAKGENPQSYIRDLKVQWSRLKEQPDTFVPVIWTEEDEEELEKLETTEIALKDTVLGRDQRRRHHDLCCAVQSMSLEDLTSLQEEMASKIAEKEQEDD